MNREVRERPKKKQWLAVGLFWPAECFGRVSLPIT